MKYLIFGNTTEQAIQFLEYLLISIPKDSIEKCQKSLFRRTLILKDGTIYQVVSASDRARGYKCDKVYVSYGIDKEIFDNVIRCCLKPSETEDKDRIIYY